MRVADFEIEPLETPLRAPHCIAMLRPWVNVGNVGHHVLSRLARIYHANEIGRLDRPSRFYDFTRYRPEIRIESGERAIRVPNTIVLAGRAPDGEGPDLVLLYMLEPHSQAEDFNDSVVALLGHLGVERYVLVGGMYDSVPHSRPLMVTGSARNWTPPESFGGVRLGRSGYQGPTSLTSQLSERFHSDVGIETLSLIVRLPLYLKLEDDYNGSAKLLEALSDVYGFPNDFPEREMAKQQYAQVDPVLDANPQLKELVAKFEADYDSKVAGEAPEPTRLAPEIEKFLDEVSGRSDEEDGDPQSGGV